MFLGRPGGFQQALEREDLQPYTFPGASGAHKIAEGIEPANVPWQIYLACSNGETIDVQTYIALHTTIDLAGLYDLIELHRVHATWLDAARINAEELARLRAQNPGAY